MWEKLTEADLLGNGRSGPKSNGTDCVLLKKGTRYCGIFLPVDVCKRIGIEVGAPFRCNLYFDSATRQIMLRLDKLGIITAKRSTNRYIYSTRLASTMHARGKSNRFAIKDVIINTNGEHAVILEPKSDGNFKSI